MKKKTITLLLALAGLAYLASSKSPPRSALNQARQDPLSGGEFSNEGYIFNAISGAGSAAEALAAANYAAEPVQIGDAFYNRAITSTMDFTSTDPLNPRDSTGKRDISAYDPSIGLNYGDWRTVQRAQAAGVDGTGSTPFELSNVIVLAHARRMGLL